ncbi:SMI1 / KNR4 family protein [Acidobacteria bacterium Mor1]|nr:SMI1 / KNR4 family protein [Acidobacteria bacterium Mor1]
MRENLAQLTAADFAGFWSGSDYEQAHYVLPPPTAASRAVVEQQLGYPLPSSYVELMRNQNGGLPARTAFPTRHPTSWADDHVAIHGILGIGDSKPHSLCGDLGSRFMMEEWGYPDIGIYFGDCPSAGHDMICLDYRRAGSAREPTVIHVDQERDYRITHLAESFVDFVRGLRRAEEF